MGSHVMEPDDIATYAEIFKAGGENHSSICMSIGKIQSKGSIFFHHANPLDYSVPLLLAQLSLASLFVLLTSTLLKPLGQPTNVIQIFGGIALGPSFVGRIGGFIELFYPYRSLVLIDAVALFGYMFYFFLIGVQIDPWILKRVEKKAFIIGVSTVAASIVLSITTSFILLSIEINVEPLVSDSLPVVATMSSVLGFPVIAHYLTELRMVNSDFGRMAMSCSLVSNMFGFLIITITSLSSQPSLEKFIILQNITAGIGFTMVIFFGVRPLIIWGTRRNPPGEPLKQGFICMIFIGVLLSGFCSKALGLHIFYGPLIYGLAIPAGPPLGSALVEKLHFIVSWLFMPIYFVKTGLVTDIFSVKLRNYLLLQSVILVACLGKFLGALISSICNQVSLRDAISIGLVTNVQGVLELGMFKMMKQNEAIADEAFVVLCINLFIATAIVTPILKSLYDPHKRYAAHKNRNVQHLKAHSELRVLACIHDQENVPATINLLEALHPSNQSHMDIAMLHLIELVGRAHPLLINHKLPMMKHVNEASASKRIINAFKVFEQNFRETVAMHPFTAISPYVMMHDEVCNMALERRASLIMIPFHKRFSSSRKTVSKVGIKIMNEKILQTAPCSVAVIVDRSLVNTSRPILDAWSSYRVAVLFLGGPDDREALALGERMAGKRNISLTIVRLLLQQEEGGKIATTDYDTIQKTMDNEMVSEARSGMAGNYRVKYVEKMIRDGTGTAAVMRSMEDEYELIIVGRRHDTQSPLLLGLSDWVEESELGPVGDMFALADSESISTILVVQQHTD
ncbi:cation/H(+) antiporter 15 isoform X1 [Nicotiana tabacum]|uniref:Cation/H(+) antiporter 15 isoform X1 n=2 Tax=Nicotiana tabacum TaxID=4097 RepID=A0A1S4C0F7_TOBAC|nr:PREDICTED: cation/H(+) antiporter 15-like isoform X1 [Nicotiana tabacum]XP_018625279.1 cation/H(+) antiporter 15-like isoform X1 [Nicotiana tomentosiformis]